MVWFQCEGCGESLKKPKLMGHMNGCRTHAFSCIDCSQTFDRTSVHLHVSCVTEHQKYALGATKPHGAGIVPVRCPSHTVPHCNRSTVTCGILESPYKVAASNGRCVIHVRPFTILEQGTAGNIQSQGAATGLEFLATRPPWRCSCCNVNCTSRETLEGHAQGKKHKSKARAAAAAAGGGAAGAAGAATAEPAAAAAPAEVEAAAAEAAGTEAAEGDAGERKKKKKEKKRAEEAAAEPAAEEEAGEEEAPKKRKKKAKSAEAVEDEPAAAAEEEEEEGGGKKKKKKKAKRTAEAEEAGDGEKKEEAPPAAAADDDEPNAKKKKKKKKKKSTAEADA